MSSDHRLSASALGLERRDRTDGNRFGRLRAAGRARATIAPASESAATTAIAGANPSRKASGEGEAAGTGEHSGSDRDPEDTAELAHHAVGAGGLADILEGEGADNGVLGRRDRH